MAGLANVGAYAAAVASGAIASATFRKTYTPSTVAGTWLDLSMVAGIPAPQYYAASPLVAASLEARRGVFHGDDVSPLEKRVHEIAMLSTTTGTTGVLFLLDYVLFYPFVDLDDTAEQTMDNTETLSRYDDDDEGLQVMAVVVAPTVGGGTFTFNYVNQDGVEKTSPVQTCSLVATVNGQILTSVPGGAAGFGPFRQLADGDRGVRSIVSVTMAVGAGGLASLVLVKPLATIALLEALVPAEVQLFQQRGGVLPRVFDGAYLNFLLNTTGTATSSNILLGRVNCMWG